MTANTKLIGAIADALVAEHGEEAAEWLEGGGRAHVARIVSHPRTAGVEVRFAGQALSGASAEDIEALEEREATERLEALSEWLAGGSEETPADESHALTGQSFLTGTSFALTGGTDEGGYASMWGRGALSRFDGREEELTLDREVESVMLGADFSRERSTLGLMVAHSRGAGGYPAPPAVAVGMRISPHPPRRSPHAR